MLSEDIAEVLRSHFPNPPATEAELIEFERAHGFPLDPELRAFYAATNGGRLFHWEGPPYYFMPLAEIVTAKAAIFPPTTRQVCPPDVFAFIDVQDGDYVGFEVTPGKLYPINDIFHESWPRETYVIAPSFAAFLHRALRSEGKQFWLRASAP
jgi:hypothetical protein